MRKTEKGDNFVMDIESFTKSYSGHLHLNIMTLAQAVLEIFCSQTSIGLQCNKMKNFEKGNNPAMTNPMDKKKIRVFLIFILIPHTKFQDPISNGS